MERVGKDEAISSIPGDIIIDIDAPDHTVSIEMLTQRTNNF